MHRTPEQLPDPWLFDSEKLLRELDRCRELVLLIPPPTHETHFAINNAVDAIWNLTQHLRYLLRLHREGQWAFAAKANTWTEEKAKAAQVNLVATVRASQQHPRVPRRAAAKHAKSKIVRITA